MTSPAPRLRFAAFATFTSLVGCAAEPSTPAVLVTKDPLALPAAVERSAPATVEVHLTAKEVVGLLDDGTKAEVWTFDGTVPGPLIRARQGDTVVVRLTNDPANAEPHSIDLHAVVGPGGGGAVTEVEPGQTAELRFRADVAGAFVYHCAAEGMPWEHTAHGMYGAILIEPPEGLPTVDREVYIAQSEWYLKPRHSGAPAKGDDDEAGGDADDGPDDVLVLDEDAATREQPSFFTFNGHVRALRDGTLYGERVHVGQGGRLRMIFANAGPNLSSSVHAMGEIFDRVYTGTFEQSLRGEETVAVPPGSAAVFEFDTPVPGTYSIVDHALYRAERGAMGDLHVDAADAWPADRYSPQPLAGGH